MMSILYYHKNFDRIKSFIADRHIFQFLCAHERHPILRDLIQQISGEASSPVIPLIGQFLTGSSDQKGRLLPQLNIHALRLFLQNENIVKGNPGDDLRRGAYLRTVKQARTILRQTDRFGREQEHYAQQQNNNRILIHRPPCSLLLYSDTEAFHFNASNTASPARVISI